MRIPRNQRQRLEADLHGLLERGVPVGEFRVMDLEMPDHRKLGPFLRRCRLGRPEPPVVLLPVLLQQKVEPVQTKHPDIERAEKHGRKPEADLQPVDMGHLRPRGPLRIGDVDVFGDHGRRPAHPDVEISVDLDLAARGVADLLFREVPEIVPVDQEQRRDGRTGENDGACEYPDQNPEE